MESNKVYSPPRRRLVKWLLDTGQDVPTDIRHALIASLFGTLPIFVGGVANTIGMALLAAIRNPNGWFISWLVIELLLGVVRVMVLAHARRAAGRGEPTHTDLYFFLALLWAGSVGYGTAVSILSGDWTIAALACLSAAAMAGGICFRNFGGPRLAATMMTLSMAPIAVAGAFSGQPIFLMTLLQIPFYLFSMSVASKKLNEMLVTTMRAERDNDHRARHDVLTGLTNRAGLEAAIGMLCKDPHQCAFALLYIDLDGFKQVNDSYGHAAGDLLLKQLADRFRSLAGPRDVAARVGGDEFVLLADNRDRNSALALARHLIDTIAAPYDLGVSKLASVGVSVGIALAPDHGVDDETLLARADLALYRAKSQGRSSTCVAEDS